MKKKSQFRRGLVQAGAGQSITPREMPLPRPIGRQFKGGELLDAKGVPVSHRRRGLVTPDGTPIKQHRRGLVQNITKASAEEMEKTDTICPRCGEPRSRRNMRRLVQAVEGSGEVMVCTACADACYKDPMNENLKWEPLPQFVRFDDNGNPFDGSQRDGLEYAGGSVYYKPEDKAEDLRLAPKEEGTFSGHGRIGRIRG